MGVPGRIPPVGPGPGRDPGRGPFAGRAFRGALVVCAVLVVVGPVLLVTAGHGGRAAGIALLVLGAVGLLAGGGGLALARMRRRAPGQPPPAPSTPPRAPSMPPAAPLSSPPPLDLPRRNGRAPHPPDLSRVRKPPRGSS
jgi:hypothetical protein